MTLAIIIVLFFGFFIFSFAIFFWFYAFISEKNANHAEIIYFSIKMRNYSKIWKILFSILKL